MIFKAKKESTIFGHRYYFAIEKIYTGIPGFAPEEYSVYVCELVVKYKDHKPYAQFFGFSNDLSAEDLKEILDKLSAGFIESDFESCEN